MTRIRSFEERQLGKIVELLTLRLPTGWQHVRITYVGMGIAHGMNMVVRDVTGREIPFRHSNELLNEFVYLRYGMYQPGRGAWLSAYFTLDYPCLYRIDYEWDEEPDWGGEPELWAISPELLFYPRDEEHTPDWLREQIAQLPADELEEQRQRFERGGYWYPPYLPLPHHGMEPLVPREEKPAPVQTSVLRTEAPLPTGPAGTAPNVFNRLGNQLTERRPFTPEEEDRKLQRIAQLLALRLPPGWVKAQAVCRSVGRYSEIAFRMFDVTGREKLLTIPDELYDEFAELRYGMYRPGRGTWLAALFTLEYPDRYSIVYNRDKEILLSQEINDLFFVQELLFYPRDEEHIPDWLRERVARAPQEEAEIQRRKIAALPVKIPTMTATRTR